MIPIHPVILYIHGQGGNAGEAQHYQPLFPNCQIIGLDYQAQTPWEAMEEFPRLLDSLIAPSQPITVIANSIGAFFAMCALSDYPLQKAYFISPIVDMQKLIEDMMMWANVTETQLQEQGEIQTAFGQTLSWEYLTYVRTHPIHWNIPTHILYGSKDNLTSSETIRAFARQTGSTLTGLEGGEHWFHTEEQMAFLDRWILSK